MDAQVSLDLGDPRTAEAVHAALIPEMDEGPDGSSVELRRDGATLIADLHGKDLSTLRAALNSFIRLADAAQRASNAG